MRRAARGPSWRRRRRAGMARGWTATASTASTASMAAARAVGSGGGAAQGWREAAAARRKAGARRRQQPGAGMARGGRRRSKLGDIDDPSTATLAALCAPPQPRRPAARRLVEHARRPRKVLDIVDPESSSHLDFTCSSSPPRPLRHRLTGPPTSSTSPSSLLSMRSTRVHVELSGVGDKITRLDLLRWQGLFWATDYGTLLEVATGSVRLLCWIQGLTVFKNWGLPKGVLGGELD